MPWGRWLEGAVGDVDRVLAAQQADLNSAGSIFAMNANALQNQIASVPTVAGIYTLEVPDFTSTRSNIQTRNVFDSPTYSFNPPRPDLSYDVSVIANIRASGVMTPFSSSMLRINGMETQVNHEANQPGFQSTPVLSIMGTGSVAGGAAVPVQFGIAVRATGTMTFRGCTLTCIFTGSI